MMVMGMVKATRDVEKRLSIRIIEVGPCLGWSTGDGKIIVQVFCKHIALQNIYIGFAYICSHVKEMLNN